MSRSRDLANLAGDATGLETLTVSDITDLTATAAELNKLDGVTASTAELNKLDGVTADTTELNLLDGVTASTTELNKLDGVTADTAELNKLDGVTASTTELNKLDGVTASTAELNYIVGATSAVQTQINGLGSKTVPHIMPGVLYPAVGGNDIHGTDIDTSHGSTYTYGTEHTDGRKYYYTDIKGSKPIKDPRIGGHFGSQRHKFKSLQLLEQETATHGKNIYSADGRKWVRFVDGNNVWQIDNDGNGAYPIAYTDCTNNFVEITGYFNDINFALGTATNRPEEIDISVNGTLSVDGSTTLGGDTTVGSPLLGRYVDSSSLINGGTTLSNSLGTTPKINTIKYEIKSGSGKYLVLFGIELIAQDTTSTANRSKIQIPSQNVVSYGKKFTVSGTPHYDPFTTMSYGGSGTTLSNLQSLIDTDTSLGMDAWKAGTSNYHRPWNGGRVVKWVDSSGAIKTSVNMMPPNAQNIGTTASNAVSDAHVIAGTNDDTINFNTSAIDHTQAEVAKTFHWREFGNGSANEGTGGANYADASMLSTTTDDIAYVMDDGLTSLSADDAGDTVTLTDFSLAGNGDLSYLTFIGTGISITGNNSGLLNDTKHIAQNLPYGTHIFKNTRGSSATGGDYIIDGVDTTVGYGWGGFREVTFYQPKRPPIPEDACVIADYMLMADYVKTTNADNPSKGIRRINCSRDWLYNSSDSTSFTAHTTVSPDPANSGSWGLKVGKQSAWNASLPYFGTQIGVTFEDNTDSGHGLLIDGSSVEGTKDSLNNASHGYADMWIPTATVTLGVHTIKVEHRSGGYRWVGGEVATPIHTSSHYQSFETPFLNELVGGDRNMEQTNLVVSPDGKTWDEVTRDTSYIGNLLLNASRDGGDISSTTFYIFDILRGVPSGIPMAFFNKDFAIAYDRFICLVEGHYKVQANIASSSADSSGIMDLKLNGDTIQKGEGDPGQYRRMHGIVDINLFLKRHDYLQYRVLDGTMEGNEVDYNYFSITRI